MDADLSGVPPEVPELPKEKWQHFIDVLAELSQVPTVLVTWVKNDQIGLFLSSQSQDNPFEPNGESCCRSKDVYCDWVVRHQKPLQVDNALRSKDWTKAPDLEQGMSFYLGYPLTWPDQTAFGTICMMDRSNDNQALKHRSLMEELRALINHDLTLLHQLRRYEAEKQRLQDRSANSNRALLEAETERDENQTALRVLLRQKESERRLMQDETREELASVLLPYIDRLEQEGLTRAQQMNALGELRLLLTQERHHVSAPCAPASVLFSAQEQKIIRYIQEDKSSKEIAELLHVAKSTVDFHRANIRKKLGLKSGSVGLKSHLLAL